MSEKFDIIIAGSGIAGLSAALEAAEHKDKSIALLDRFDGTHSNSFFAQGGIACAMGKGDSWQKHAQDTLSAGAGLCNEEAVEFITKNGPDAVRGLMDSGLGFDGGNENPDFGLEGGHSEKRVLHIKGDQTGKEMTRFMRKLAQEQKNIYAFNGTHLSGILTEKGAYTGTRTIGKETEMSSNALVLATGGHAACFGKTTNPETTMGNGIAVAHRAGCALEGMEFVQFHPTTLRSAVGSNFLVSEAVRGEGGRIVDENGRQIVNPLDTRDKVSIAIYKETAKGRKVFLDARGIRADFAERFPAVFAELKKNHIDPEKDLIPIEAAAHYTIGGIRTGLNAESSMKGVYAAGECANSGLHGANRLASNSLLEGLVMGKLAGKNAALHKDARANAPEPREAIAMEGIETGTAIAEMRRTMWHCCGVIRNEAGLNEGLAAIKDVEQKIEISEDAENAVVRGALLVCRKTIEAALARRESIGAHCREN